MNILKIINKKLSQFNFSFNVLLREFKLTYEVY